jgi:hypothetical protein
VFDSMKSRGPSIERSTCDSAAKFTTALGRKFAERARDGVSIGDVAVDENEVGMRGDVAEAGAIAGVGELVDHRDPHRAAREGHANEVAADEARAAGDQPGLHPPRIPEPPRARQWRRVGREPRVPTDAPDGADR